MLFNETYFFNGHARWNLFWASPNYAGAALCCVLPVLIGCAIGSRPTYHRLVVTASLILQVLTWFALAETGSRGAIVAALFSVFYLFAFACRYQTKLFWASIALAAGIGLTMGDFNLRFQPAYIASDGSIHNRLTLWRRALGMLWSSPLSGWGCAESGRAYMNWFQPVDETQHYTTTVNSYLHIGVEYGLFPLGVIICLVVFVLLLPLLEPSSLARPLNSQLLSSAILLAWCTANVFSTLWIEPTLWIIPGIAILTSVRSIFRRPAGLGPYMLWSAQASAIIIVILLGLGMHEASISPYNILSLDRKTHEIEVSLRTTPGQGPRLTWGLWPDKNVFGVTPGHEIRRLLKASTGNNSFFIHQSGDFDRGEQVRLLDGALLFGDQCALLKVVLSSVRDGGHVWLIVPLCVPTLDDTVSLKNIHIGIILPEIDIHGFKSEWIRWAGAHNARLYYTHGTADDIRGDWPEVAINTHILESR